MLKAPSLEGAFLVSATPLSGSHRGWGAGTVEVCLLSPLVSPALGPSGSSSATPNAAGSLAEVVAMLVKCGAVRLTGSAGDPTAGEGNGEL